MGGMDVGMEGGVGGYELDGCLCCVSLAFSYLYPLLFDLASLVLPFVMCGVNE